MIRSAVCAAEQSGGAAAAFGGVELVGLGEVQFHPASEGVDLVGPDRLTGSGSPTARPVRTRTHVVETHISIGPMYANINYIHRSDVREYQLDSEGLQVAELSTLDPGQLSGLPEPYDRNRRPRRASTGACHYFDPAPRDPPPSARHMDWHSKQVFKTSA